jgi:uncharacterized glyoxalase superfamily protein PhnB
MSTATNQSAQTLYPALRYRDAKAAISWLKAALGFTEHAMHENEDGSIAHAELALNGGMIMLGSVRDDSFGKSPRELGAVTATIYVALESAADVEAHYKRAASQSASIVREPNDTDYGSREFAVSDPEGHVWTFGSYRPQTG